MQGFNMNIQNGLQPLCIGQTKRKSSRTRFVSSQPPINNRAGVDPSINASADVVITS